MELSPRTHGTLATELVPRLTCCKSSKLQLQRQQKNGWLWEVRKRLITDLQDADCIRAAHTAEMITGSSSSNPHHHRSSCVETITSCM
eukprot:13328-Heterococcus_DN1.PRE.1